MSFCALTAGASAQAEWVGGAFVSLPEWNAAATAAIGQQASVYRLFMAFNESDNILTSIHNPSFQARNGELYQDPLGGNLPPTQGAAELIPSLAWDTYVTIGTQYQPTLSYTAGDFAFTSNGMQFTNGAWLVFGNSGEGVALAPGGTDINGNVVIPETFDPTLRYVLAGQFTLLGVEAHTATPPDFTSGVIHSDQFVGNLDVFYIQGGTVLVQNNVQIIPAPGAFAAMLGVAGFAAGARRRAR